MRPEQVVVAVVVTREVTKEAWVDMSVVAVVVRP
jgi:hypothetical protein